MPFYDVSIEFRGVDMDADADEVLMSDVRRTLPAGKAAYCTQNRTFRYSFPTEDISQAAARLQGDVSAAWIMRTFFPGTDQSQVDIRVTDAVVRFRTEEQIRNESLLHRHYVEQRADQERGRRQSALIRRVVRQELADILSDLADTLPSQNTALRDVERRLRNRLHHDTDN